MYKTTGFIGFLFRRISGLALVFYLALHIWVIGSATAGPEVFDRRLAFVQTPFFKMMEIALLAAVVYHGFDGIRVMLAHYFNITEYRKSTFYAMFAIFVLVTIAGGIPLFLFMLQGL